MSLSLAEEKLVRERVMDQGLVSIKDVTFFILLSRLANISLRPNPSFIADEAKEITKDINILMAKG